MLDDLVFEAQERELGGGDQIALLVVDGDLIVVEHLDQLVGDLGHVAGTRPNDNEVVHIPDDPPLEVVRELLQDCVREDVEQVRGPARAESHACPPASGRHAVDLHEDLRESL